MELVEVQIYAHIEALAMNFSNSFFSDISLKYTKYEKAFSNSNVVEQWETLDNLLKDLDKKRPNLGLIKDIKLVESILESYTFLIRCYKEISNITILSPKLKRYDMIKDLQSWCIKTRGNGSNPEMTDKLDKLIDHIKPQTKHLSEAEALQKKAKADISKMLLK